MEKGLKEFVGFKCKPEERAELRRVSESLAITESSVIRAALRVGLA